MLINRLLNNASKKKYLLVAGFLFVAIFLGKKITFPTSNINQFNIDNRHNLHRKMPAQYANQAINSYVVFHLDRSTQLAYLTVKSATIKQALDQIIKETHFTLITTDDGQHQLQKTISMETQGSTNAIIQALLKKIPHKIIELEDIHGKDKKTFYCVGKNACSNLQPLFQIVYDASINMDSSIIPSENFHQALAVEISPDSTEVSSNDKPGSFYQKNQTLKDEFRYASISTKIKILNTLDASLDPDFFINALHYEFNIRVRQTAARELFLSNDTRSVTVLLEILNDPDEILVMTIFDVISNSNNTELIDRAHSIIAKRQSKTLQKMVENRI